MVGILLGFAGGRWSASSDAQVTAAMRSDSQTRAVSTSRTTSSPESPSVREWVNRLQALDQSGYEEMLVEALSSHGRFGGYPSFHVQAVLQAWTEVDADAALRFVFARKEDERYAALPGIVLAFWAERDAEAAVQAFQRLPSASSQPAILFAMIPAVARTAPHLAIRLVDQMEPGREGTAAMILLSSLIQNDSTAAAEWINGMADGPAKNRMLAQYYQQLAKEDPREAATAALQQLSGRQRNEQLGRIVGEWGRSSFAEALEFVQSLSDAGLRLEAQDSLAWAAAGGALPPEEAIAWITANVSGRTMAGAVQLVIRNLAETDPLRAARVVADLPLGRSYQSGLTTLASSWAGSDPVGAYRWLQEIPAGAERQRAFSAFSRSFAEANPDRAIRFLAEVSDPAERATLVRDVAAQIADDDPAAALRWSDAIQDDALRQEAQRSVILAWTEQNPVAVARFVLERTDLNLSSSEFRRIGSAYAARDPAGAGEWIFALPAEVQPRVVDMVVREWVGSDAYAASEWVANLPEGAVRESAVENMVRMVMRFEPDSAFAWATTLSDDSNRRRLTSQAAGVWGVSDPEAAMAAVRQADLPAEEKERLLGAIQAGEGAGPAGGFGRGSWWWGRGP